MKKILNLFLLTGLLFFVCGTKVLAFDGSTLTSGSRYYLYNLYQSKFLQSGGTTLSRTASATFTATSTGFTINDKAYTASVISGKKYKLTDASGNALMFNANTSCTTGDYSSGFNASKSEWLLISTDEYNTYAAKNRFTVAALNVDGMPTTITIAGVYTYNLNPDGKEEAGATAIGNKLKTLGYDIIGVSEDFNYHDNIVSALGDGFSFGTNRGKIETSATAYARIFSSTSPVFDTDGLGFITRNSTSSFSNESWTAWTKHYGYTSDGADGLIDKGYRYYTVTLTDGTKLDVYILHMDAETSADDNDARASQLQQLATAIKASSNGRPVIVMGDTNCRYTRDRIQSLFINSIEEDSRFTVEDPWITFGRNGIYPACDGTNDNSIMVEDEKDDDGNVTNAGVGYLKGEVVDKVFYINNKESDIRISALSYAQDLSFVNDAGEFLSDHKPTVVEFEYHTYDPDIDDTEKTIEEYKWVGVDPTAGGTYYIYHPQTGKFLTNDGANLALGYITTTTWNITKQSVSESTYTVNMKSNNGDYYFYLNKTGTIFTSATPALSKTSQTIQISKSDNATYSSMNPFKIHRTASPARYFNYGDDGFKGAEKAGDQNDWVFIPVEQYNEQHAQDYIENGVHYYKGIYTSGNTPTIAATMPTSTSTIATKQAYDFDFTYATGDGFSSIKVDVSANPNAIIYAKKGKVTNDKNVVIAETDKCANLVLTDEKPVYIPSKFIATSATYTRKSTSKWGTIIFPYAPVKKEGYTYFTLLSENVEGGVLRFKSVDGDLSANTPYLYRNTTGENLDLSTSDAAVYAAANVPNKISTSTDVEGWNMIGVYETTSVFATQDKMDSKTDITNNKVVDAYSYYIKADGSGFAAVNGYFNMSPFRAYFSAGNAGSAKPSFLTFSVDDVKATGIKMVENNDGTVDMIFDLSGKKLTKLQKGINIINGKKVLVK